MKTKQRERTGDDEGEAMTKDRKSRVLTHFVYDNLKIIVKQTFTYHPRYSY